MKQKQLLSFLVCILMLSSCAAPTDSARDSGLTLRVYFADAEEIRLLPLEDYVFGALAAEMPANYAPEALKCQAIAARTRAVAQSHAFGGNGCVRHPDCDICTDSACCQAYQTDAQLHARWGSEYVVLRARIDRAVRATDGLLGSPAAACPSKCCTTPVPAERLKMPPPCSHPPSRIWSA